MAVRNLSLRETQYLIANKPLALVNLEHSKHNKKIVIKALSGLWKDRAGQKTFEVLQTFLRDVAPKYKLSSNQDGVRRFLLKEMERIANQQKVVANRKSFFSGMAGLFKLASS